MAATTTTTPAACGGEVSITVEATAHAGDDARLMAESRRRSSEVEESERIEVQQISAGMVRRKLTRLNTIVFCIALLEWAGNAVGTLAFLWGTVVVLGGFSSQLSHTDFWGSTVMIFIEASRVFIRNDASINQWLFGSTSAFRWEDFSSPHMLVQQGHYGRNIIAVIIGVGITLTPLEFRPEIVASIVKVALLVITSQLLTRLRGGTFARIVLILLVAAAYIGGLVGFYKMGPHKFATKPKYMLANLKFVGLFMAWICATGLAASLAVSFMSCLPFMRKPVPLLCFKVIIAFGLACFPFLQARLASSYRYYSIAVALVLLSLSNHENWVPADSSISETETSEQNNSSPPPETADTSEQHSSSSCGLLLQIVETVLPILFFWSVMFPLPGISLKISFYMLYSVIAAVLIGNLQIPVAFLQVLLSVLRLRNLLDHHHHDYRPLPPDASPNLVPSIVIFFMMELCQASSYIMAVILGLISFLGRRSLVRDLEFKQDWGAKAVNLYHRQAYQARTERGLFPSEKSTPSLTSFAIEALGSTSSEMQIVGLRVLDNFLERWDTKSKMELITEITYFSKEAVPALIAMLGSRHQDTRLLAATIINKVSGSLKISEFPGMLKLIYSLLDTENKKDYSMPNHASENNEVNDIECELIEKLTFMQWICFYLLGFSILEKLACDPDNCAEIAKDATNIIMKIIGLISYLTDRKNSGETQEKITVCDSALKFVRRIASKGDKTGARFRQELSDQSPFFLNSLERILDFEDCQQPELCKLVMDIIANMALDEAARQEIGSTQSIIRKLMHEFLRPDDVINPSENNDRRSLRKAAGEALENLTIMSTDNCWAILLADPEHNLVKNLSNMLEDEYYICVAANLLHNLCANSRDKLIDLDANVHLKSALQMVMQIIRTKEGKQLEAALCAASQIGYVIPENFAQMFESDTNAAAAAAELAEKLVDALNSNREPCLECPRIRRVLVEVVILTVDLCPGYKKIFKEKGVKDALDMVKGTPSRLEKHRVFLNGQGVVAESLPMRDLVDKAKTLIH